jgi:aryl-alcohol dehydrogenase-like predicted oxidoreductase
MERRRLGRTDILVSKLCLGTMTWGEQNTEAEAFAQLDRALERGVNFIDTAEAYPIPMKEETQGRTERYIGSWLKQRKNRDKIVLATKVAGPMLAPYLRASTVGRTCPDRKNIMAAIDASLARLQVDYVDLYQVHWPDRRTNFFGRLGYAHDPKSDQTPIEETHEAMSELVKAGKVRQVGISNESAWGAMHYLQLSETRGFARPASIQNPYSLLNRSFEVGLAEVAQREDLGLLAYSPLGFGALTGKYANGARPEGARLTLFPQYARYTNTHGLRAAERYLALARQHGLNPAQMALAFAASRGFVTSVILGATSVAQLDENLGAAELVLPEEVLKGIEEIHAEISNPCP